MAPRDPDLIERLRRRDPATLQRVVDDHARRLYRAARGMGLGAAEAEDVVQEVFLTFLTTLARFEGRSTISTWLFGILHHKMQDRRRDEARGRQMAPIDEDLLDHQFDAQGKWIVPPIAPDRLATSRQAGVAVRQCLDDLPPLQREVFHLRQVEELPAADVGAMVGESDGHVGVLLHRARLRLRECLDRKGWKATP
jgi:RNA polymerase sigma-70 factor (ECF subfamily)